MKTDQEPDENTNIFIQDIQCMLRDINKDHENNKLKTQEYFQTIASNPHHTYTSREQIAILIDIMNRYNKNIEEYQKNMQDLSTIARNIIKSQRSISSESHSSDDTIVSGSSSSLYNYFMQLLWGKPSTHKNNLTAVQPGREPSVDLRDIFAESETDEIQHNPAQLINAWVETDTSEKKVKRRNTVQPIIKHIPHL